MKTVFIAFVAGMALIASCSSGKTPDDQAMLEDEVRNYFMLDDSVDVTVTLTDTIRVPELEEMLNTLDNNFSLIQQDIDTLKTIIDDWSYKALTAEQQGLTAEAQDTRIRSLEYRLQLKELEAQKEVFVQTARILNHLKRSIWANIAGFDAIAEFKAPEGQQSHTLLLDADYRIVD